MWIIDWFPRNRLVALGTTLVTSCLTVEAALVANFPVGPGQNDAALRAAAAMTFCYIVSNMESVRGDWMANFTSRLSLNYSSTALSMSTMLSFSRPIFVRKA